MNVEAAAAAITAKGYRTSVRANISGPIGRGSAVYVCGPYVNKFIYADINGQIADTDVANLKDVTGHVAPYTALHAG